MKSADIVAIFSEYEGLPNAICEGMMIGKPIIMTKVSDFYTLVDESNGFLCDWNKTESIKQVFEKAINLDENTLIKMGNASKEKAVRLFSQNTIMNQFFIIL
jgi:glycosyltransferase involved in cell wall biosynthesis